MNNAQAEAVNLCWMSKKRSANAQLRAFGEWLADQRGEASREQISIKLRNLGVPLGGSTLAQYEKGTVWAPDAGVLWGLSRIYKCPLELMVGLLRVNRSNPSFKKPDLLRANLEAVTPSSDSASEAAGLEGTHGRRTDDDAASARRLESRLEEYDALVPELERVTKALVRVAVKRAKDAETARSQSGSGRRHRKTG